MAHERIQSRVGAAGRLSPFQSRLRVVDRHDPRRTDLARLWQSRARDAAGFGRGAADRCAGRSQRRDHLGTGTAIFSSDGACPRDYRSREPRARHAPSGSDGCGSTARSSVPWSGCWSARGGPRHPPSVPRPAGVPRRTCRAGGGCGNSRCSPRPRECSCLLLNSTIFRSGCFTLGRRDATARTKQSGTGHDQRRCHKGRPGSETGIAVPLGGPARERTCVKHGPAACQTQCGPDRAQASAARR